MKLTLRILLLLVPFGATLASAQHVFDHIIILVQENRTPDNLFQGLCMPPFGTAASCPSAYNISPNGVKPEDGTSIPLTPDSLADDLDPDHGNKSFVQMYNGGGVNQGPTKVGCRHSLYCCPNQAPSCVINGVKVYNWLHYVPNDPFSFNNQQTNRLDPYLALATQYGWANYFFQTNQGPSFPAHQFLLSGTSASSAPPNALFVAENPGGSGNAFNLTGCTSPSDEHVRLIDKSGKETTNNPIYPCFDHPTLTDLLNNASRNWKWYTANAGSMWTAPNAINHMCGPVPTTSPGDVCAGLDWTNGVSPYIGTGKVLTDLGVNGTNTSACQLPAVSWVIPDGTWSDHAGLLGVGYAFGPAWVADIVDAVGGTDNQGHQLPVQCHYWQNTAILVVWDDWGGWYDHVQPFKVLLNTQGNPCNVWGCGYVYNFRVPFLFISAFTPQHFISGTVSGTGTTCPTGAPYCYDFGSILAFVESNFGLGNVFGQNQYADFFAKTLDRNFYNLSSARTFTPILTPVPPGCFINPQGQGCFPNYTGPVDPDDDAIEPSN